MRGGRASLARGKERLALLILWQKQAKFIYTLNPCYAHKHCTHLGFYAETKKSADFFSYERNREPEKLAQGGGGSDNKQIINVRPSVHGSLTPN